MPTTTPTSVRCAGCFHPDTAHHPSMAWCTHHVGEAHCVCEEFVPMDARP